MLCPGHNITFILQNVQNVILDENSSFLEEKLRKFKRENNLSDSKEIRIEIINSRKASITNNCSMHIIIQSLVTKILNGI